MFLKLKNQMNNFDSLKKFILKYFLILLGFVLFILYMWNRFFRERTPKNLPLTLNIIYVVILVYICILFTYLIYTLIFPRKTSIMVQNLIEFLFTPLKELDIFIKEIPKIKPYYFKIIIYLFEKVEDMIIDSNKFFYMFWLFPRIILIAALYIDVFVFHRFHYKYMVILFGLLLFFNKYLMYSLKYYKTQTIDVYKNDIKYILTDYVSKVHPSEFEEDYDEDEDEPGPTMTLPFETFIDFQTNSIVYHNKVRSIITIRETSKLDDYYWTHYAGHPHPDFFNKTIPKDYVNNFGDEVPNNYYEARSFIHEKIQEYLKHVLESTTRICLVIEYYKKNNNENKKIKAIKIFIYSSYLICWSYVLFISLKTYTISVQDIIIIAEILQKSQDSYNVFSGIAEVEDHNLIFFSEKNYTFYYYLYYRMKLFYLSKILIMCLIVCKARFFVKIRFKCDIIKTLLCKILMNAHKNNEKK